MFGGSVEEYLTSLSPHLKTGSPKPPGSWQIRFEPAATPGEKFQIRELVADYDRTTKTAPTWYKKDYYVLLAGYPVIITWKENG